MSNDKQQGINWDDTEKEESRDYIGLVTVSEVREIPPERFLEWTKPPLANVTPRELHIEVQPLSVDVLRTNRDGEEVSVMEYDITIDKADGSTKRANSGIGKLRESSRKLGFPDPTTIAGRVFSISETRQKFGSDGGGFRVTLLTEYHRDGYTHPGGEKPLWDFRKKDDSQGMPESAPMTRGGDVEKLTEETAMALAAALDGVKEDDTAAINNAGRRVQQASVVRTLQYNGELIPLLVEMGAITVAKGVIHMATANVAAK